MPHALTALPKRLHKQGTSPLREVCVCMSQSHLRPDCTLEPEKGACLDLRQGPAQRSLIFFVPPRLGNPTACAQSLERCCQAQDAAHFPGPVVDVNTLASTCQ